MLDSSRALRSSVGKVSFLLEPREKTRLEKEVRKKGFEEGQLSGILEVRTCET